MTTHSDPLTDAELEAVKDARAAESDERIAQLRALPGWCRACPPGCNSCLGPDCECYEHDELTVEGQNSMIWDLQSKLGAAQDEAARLRALKCAACGMRVAHLNANGYVIGWGCADGGECDAPQMPRPPAESAQASDIAAAVIDADYSRHDPTTARRRRAREHGIGTGWTIPTEESQ